MNKMTPIFLVLAIVALGGLAFAGYSMRKSTGGSTFPTPMTYPTNATPTGAVGPTPTVSAGYQAGMSLTINSPANGLEVATPNVTVTGSTAPYAEVFVNETSGTADVNGNFSVSVPLDEGDNTVVVTANDANGNSAEQEVTVSYNAGA